MRSGLYSTALEIAQKAGQPNILAEALLGLGNGYKAQGDLNQAKEFHAKAASTFQQLNSASGESVSLSNLASDYDELGEKDRALSSFLEAKRVAKNAPVSNRWRADYLLGDFYRQRGQFEKALSSYREALEISTQGRAFEKSGWSYLAIGSLDTVIGDWDDAISESQAALELFQETKSKDGQGASWALLTSVCYI